MEYRNAVDHQAVAIKEEFPRKINMTNIYACKQKGDEDTNDFITRVIEAVTMYSGIETPTEVGTEAGVWETLVCDAVIKGMLPLLAQHLKGAYVGWADHPRLADFRRHAKHAQLMFEERQRSKKEASDKELHLATITMYHNVGRNREGGYRRKRGPQRGPGRRFCDPDTCFKCGRKGHWKDQCPYPAEAASYQAD
ncbi:hypothetical protein XENORESO_003093 [Xenotaenia resolanae]|uniref:CCHC-type domain-containing protein n=1 Tax=Xenotaenia resolanae TaxID=208358 RepID=A0ABV0VNL7_9TELE